MLSYQILANWQCEKAARYRVLLPLLFIVIFFQVSVSLELEIYFGCNYEWSQRLRSDEYARSPMLLEFGWRGVRSKCSLQSARILKTSPFFCVRANKAAKSCACRLGPLASQISQKELVQSTVHGFFFAAIAGGNENKGTEIGAPSRREGVGWGPLFMPLAHRRPDLDGRLKKCV